MNECADTSCVITAPAAANALRPTIVPHTTTTPAPSVAPSPTSVGSSWSLPSLRCARGLAEAVRVHEHPGHASAPASTSTTRCCCVLVIPASGIEGMAKRIRPAAIWAGGPIALDTRNGPPPVRL